MFADGLVLPVVFISGNDLTVANESLKGKLKKYRDLLADNDSPAVKITVFFATNGLIHKDHKALSIIEECEKKSIYCQFVDATEFGEDIKVEKGELKVNLKESEDKELADWARQIQTTKEQIERVDQKLFSKVE